MKETPLTDSEQKALADRAAVLLAPMLPHILRGSDATKKSAIDRELGACLRLAAVIAEEASKFRKIEGSLVKTDTPAWIVGNASVSITNKEKS